jgi:hypothetical protein
MGYHRGAITEHMLQRSVVQHLRLRGVPGLVFWHTANERSNVRERMRLKAEGVRAGVSDLIMVHQGRMYCLELKIGANKATQAQQEFIHDMETAGAYCCVAQGIDRALAVLTAWGLIR